MEGKPPAEINAAELDELTPTISRSDIEVAIVNGNIDAFITLLDNGSIPELHDFLTAAQNNNPDFLSVLLCSYEEHYDDNDVNKILYAFISNWKQSWHKPKEFAHLETAKAIVENIVGIADPAFLIIENDRTSTTCWETQKFMAHRLNDQEMIKILQPYCEGLEYTYSS
jgi:hypothetical protein